MNCPACDCAEMGIDIHTQQPDREMNLQEIIYKRCLLCGLVQRTPLPDKTELRAYYEKAWQFSEPRPSSCFESAAEFIAQSLHTPQIGSAIDVGAKDSHLLRAVEQFGIKIAVKSALDAQPVSSEVQTAWIGDGYYNPVKYDLVVATHILEHAINPLAFMRDLRGMTAFRGHVYIEVPSLEISHEDVSTCDDINPNHLWHFTLQSLCLLATSCGFSVVSARSDGLVAGWPSNRILLQNRLTSGLSILNLAIEDEYAKASKKIKREWRDGDALYGASYSCWKLLPMIGPTLIFDLYKTGMIRGKPICGPAGMVAANIRRVWLTPRFWNSQKEIGGWLKANYPTIEVLCPYEDMPS